MSTGLVFVTTGGSKMVRALRSFRRTEPDLPVHIAMATSSKVWEGNNSAVPSSYFESQPNVQLRHVSTSGYINGSFNEAIKWMRELGHSHACTIQDDVVFSPLPKNRYHISSWFDRPELAKYPGLSLSAMEALVRTEIPGCWHRSPAEWDSVDLESEAVWSKLLPNGEPALYFGSPGSEDGVVLSDWFVKYFVTPHVCPMARLGPTGQIVSISAWEAVDGFSETNGIFYDMEFPVTTARAGFPPVMVIPNTPYIHLHCQSTIGDPAVGIWGHDLASFVEKYGSDPSAVLRALPNGGGY